MSLSHILRNIHGEIEIGRVWLSVASGAAIVSPIVFQGWDMARGAHFDVTAWCVAYPGGLAALVTAGILGIGRKDQNIEAARATKAATDQGAQPC